MNLFSSSNPNQQQISHKRQQFYLQIKQRSRQSIMKAIRCKYLKQQREEASMQLINKTQSQISSKQLFTLFMYAKKGIKNAVIHIANLFLQGILDQRVFSELGENWLLQIDINCGYYEYLLYILVCKQFIDATFHVYLLAAKSLITSKTQDQFRILNLLKCLTQLAKSHHEDFISKLIIPHFSKQYFTYMFKFCYSKNHQIVKQSWRLASFIFGHQQFQISNKIVQIFGINNLLQLIKLGLLSKSVYIRSLTCQIFTNNLRIILYHNHLNPQYDKSKINFDNIISTCYTLVLSQKQKISVKLQISYLIINYLQMCSFQNIIQQVQHGLIKVIKQLRDINTINIINQELNRNCISICQILCNICHNMQNKIEYNEYYAKKILCEMDNYGLLNFGENQMEMEITL